MGGHKRGDLASQLCIDSVQISTGAGTGKTTAFQGLLTPLTIERMGTQHRAAIEYANRRIGKAAMMNWSLREWGRPLCRPASRQQDVRDLVRRFQITGSGRTHRFRRPLPGQSPSLRPRRSRHGVSTQERDLQALTTRISRTIVAGNGDVQTTPLFRRPERHADRDDRLDILQPRFRRVNRHGEMALKGLNRARGAPVLASAAMITVALTTSR